MKHSELRHQPRHVNPRIQEIPQTDDFRYEKQELSEKADAKFNNFIETQKFLYSDKYYNEEKRLALLSPQENKIYFYIVPIAEMKVLP